MAGKENKKRVTRRRKKNKKPYGSKEKAFIVQGEKVIEKEKNVSISEYRNIDSLKIALETCRVNEFSAVLITDKESEVKMFEKEECIKKIILPEYLKGDVKELIKTKGIYL